MITSTHNGRGEGCPRNNAKCSPAYLCEPCCYALIAESEVEVSRPDDHIARLEPVTTPEEIDS